MRGGGAALKSRQYGELRMSHSLLQAREDTSAITRPAKHRVPGYPNIYVPRGCDFLPAQRSTSNSDLGALPPRPRIVDVAISKRRIATEHAATWEQVLAA